MPRHTHKHLLLSLFDYNVNKIVIHNVDESLRFRKYIYSGGISTLYA